MAYCFCFQQLKRSIDSMEPVSTNLQDNTTTKRLKIRRTQPVIARKVIAFHELVNLEYNKKSAREAADLLEVANSTMQSWRDQINILDIPKELVDFFSTPVGLDFVQRNVMAVMKLMKCGPGGIRGMQEYLRNSLGAQHISELFHGQHEISKATSAPLASQEKASEKVLYEVEEKAQRLIQKPRRIGKKERKKQALEIEETLNLREAARIEFEQRSKRREEVKAATREMGKIHHPISLKSGALQTADIIKERFNEQFEIIYERAEEANLSEPSIDRI